MQLIELSEGRFRVWRASPMQDLATLAHDTLPRVMIACLPRNCPNVLKHPKSLPSAAADPGEGSQQSDQEET